MSSVLIWHKQCGKCWMQQDLFSFLLLVLFLLVSILTLQQFDGNSNVLCDAFFCVFFFFLLFAVHCQFAISMQKFLLLCVDLKSLKISWICVCVCEPLFRRFEFGFIAKDSFDRIFNQNLYAHPSMAKCGKSNGRGHTQKALAHRIIKDILSEIVLIFMVSLAQFKHIKYIFINLYSLSLPRLSLSLSVCLSFADSLCEHWRFDIPNCFTVKLIYIN